MNLLYEIQYINRDGESVHSDVCAKPGEDGIPKYFREHMQELMEKADFTKPWKLEGVGICSEHK